MYFLEVLSLCLWIVNRESTLEALIFKQFLFPIHLIIIHVN